MTKLSIGVGLLMVVSGGCATEAVTPEPPPGVSIVASEETKKIAPNLATWRVSEDADQTVRIVGLGAAGDTLAEFTIGAEMSMENQSVVIRALSPQPAVMVVTGDTVSEDSFKDDPAAATLLSRATEDLRAYEAAAGDVPYISWKCIKKAAAVVVSCGLMPAGGPVTVAIFGYGCICSYASYKCHCTDDKVVNVGHGRQGACHVENAICP